MEGPRDNRPLRVHRRHEPRLEVGYDLGGVVIALPICVVLGADHPQVQVGHELLSGDARHHEDGHVDEGDLARREGPATHDHHAERVHCDEHEDDEHADSREMSEPYEVVVDQGGDGAARRYGDREDDCY